MYSMTKRRSFPPFYAQVCVISNTPVASIFGEVDLATVAELREALRHAARLTLGSREVRRSFAVADLRGVEFLDALGISALAETHRSLRALGSELRLLIPAEGAALRSLEAAGADFTPGLYMDLTSALKEARSPLEGLA